MDSNPITHPDMNKNAKGWLSPEGDGMDSNSISQTDMKKNAMG